MLLQDYPQSNPPTMGHNGEDISDSRLICNSLDYFFKIHECYREQLNNLDT